MKLKIYDNSLIRTNNKTKPNEIVKEKNKKKHMKFMGLKTNCIYAHNNNNKLRTINPITLLNKTKMFLSGFINVIKQ